LAAWAAVDKLFFGKLKLLLAGLAIGCAYAVVSGLFFGPASPAAVPASLAATGVTHDPFGGGLDGGFGGADVMGGGGSQRPDDEFDEF